MNRQLLEVAERDRDTLVVLYYLPDNEHTPYVTWIRNKGEPEKTYFGNYFETREEAEEDLDRRSFRGEIGLYDVMEALEVPPNERRKLWKEFRGF